MTRPSDGSARPASPDPVTPGPNTDTPGFASATSPVSTELNGPIDEGLRVTLPGEAGPTERWLWRGLLAVLCLLAYVNSFSTVFIWDDNRHAGAPAVMRDFNGLVSIWTKLGLENGGTPQYYPLTHTMYWLEYQIWGRSAVPYRIVNVLVHAGAAMVLWELLRRLRVPGAFLAAAIFALHPLMTESVAWTSERKNTFSLLLGLTAILLYARFTGIAHDEELDGPPREPDAPPDWNLYALAALAFVAAMLSKTVAASVPVIILLMLWWKRKLTPRHLGLIAPMLVLAVAMGLLTGYVEHHGVIRPPPGTREDTFTGWLTAKLTGQLSSGPEWDIPFSQRLLQAGLVPWFYFSKLVWPANLVFFYPRWDLAGAPAWWWLAHAGILAVVAAAVFAATRGVRWPLVVVLGYLVALFPTMGFVDVYPFRYSFVADHFSYHAVWLLIVAAAALIAVAADRLGLLRNAKVALASGAALLAVLGTRTYFASGHFIDNYALFSHVVANNPGSWAAAHNLAVERLNLAERSDSVYRQLVAAGEMQFAREAKAEVEENLVAAEKLLNRTLELKPDHGWAHYNLGRLAVLRNDAEGALAMFQTSARVRSEGHDDRDGPYAPTFAKIGDLLSRKGDITGALENLRKSISYERPPLQPKQPYVRMLLLRLELRELAGAAQKYAAANRPTTAPTTLPTTTPTTAPAPARPLPTTLPASKLIVLLPPYLSAEKADELVRLAREVTDLLPRNDEGWLYAADLMKALGQPSEALAAYREAVTINARNVDALVGLGIALGQFGDYVGARVAFEEAIRLSPTREDARRLLDMTLTLARQAATQPATTQPASSPPATAPAAPAN